MSLILFKLIRQLRNSNGKDYEDRCSEEECYQSSKAEVECKKPMYYDGYAFTVAKTSRGLKKQTQRLLCPEKLTVMMAIVRGLQ